MLHFGQDKRYSEYTPKTLSERLCDTHYLVLGSRLSEKCKALQELASLQFVQTSPLQANLGCEGREAPAG